MEDKMLVQYQNKLKDIKRDTERFIRRHYGKKPRSEIARLTGIPKYELNMMLIQMKLGR